MILILNDWAYLFIIVSTTEHASIVVEQSEVASGRSIRGGSFRQLNHNDNPNERPLRTTGFAFKGRNAFGDDGQTSPIPFLIPSYASGIIFRNSDNDRTPQVEIQPSIHVASKTIGPEEESTATDTFKATTTTTTTANTFRRTRPTPNVNAVNSFERRTFTPFQTTTFRTTTVAQPSIVQNEVPSISPIQPVLTTLSPPLAPSQIHARPTVNKPTNQPRFSDITKRIDVLGLQAPGYAVRSDGTIDSDALPPNFVINSNTNFASNNLNPFDIDAAAAASTTTQMTHTTTPRVTRKTTTKFQHFLPTAFIPSNDNPFLPHQKSKQQNLNATPAPFTAFQSTSTKANTLKGFTTFATTVSNNRNQQAIGNGFTTSFAPQTSANSSPFNRNGIDQNSPKAPAANGQFGNQLNSRQSKSNNELSFNAQQQAQRKNSQIVLNLDNRARLPSFGVAETTTFPSFASSSSSFTTKRVQSFANNPIPTAKAPAGFSFAAFAKTTPKPRTRIAPTTNFPTTFSTIFPSKYTFVTIPTTVPPQPAQTNELPSVNAAAAPSVELLPPITSNSADAKSAFAPINEAGALIRTKSPAFSTGATNRNQPQQQPNNKIKPFNTNNNSAQKVNNGFTAFPITTTRRPTIVTTTKSPIRHRPTISTTPFRFTTTTPTPTITITTAAAAPPLTTPSSFASFAHHQNQPNAKAQQPFTDLLPPIESDSQSKESSFVPSTNVFEQSPSIAISLPDNDLLPPPLSAASDAQTQNANANVNAASATAAAAAAGTKTKVDHQHQQQNPGLELNPFLPPVDAVSKSPAVSTNTNTESNFDKNNNHEFETITLEQNPFLPQLDLNPFLPPFVFTASENDPGFGFGAGTPPPKDDDDNDDDTNAS